MTLIDISVGIIPEMPIYDGDPPAVIERIMTVWRDGSAVGHISMGSH
jgi:kynurenine formamidase